MRAVVIGASGQVGAALRAALLARGHEVVGTHHGVPQPGTRPLDLTDLGATAALVAEVRPHVVFCPAGTTIVDHCEDYPDEAYRVNAEAPAAAAAAAAAQGAAFVFFSTEYVFDGVAGPYAENDPVKPLSVYGASKLEGERRVAAANTRALIVRTTVVYGPEPQGKNFVLRLVRAARSGERVRVPADQRSSPTYNPDLAAAVLALVERGVTGVVHVAGPEVMDRHAFAALACEVFGLDPGCLVPVTTAELRQRAPRPLNAGLRIDRVRALIPTRLSGPREGLTALRASLTAGGAGGR